MSDCSNVEIRDALPDYARGALGSPERERIAAHLTGCAECRAELELLQSVRAAMPSDSAYRVDVPRIVASLPRPARGRAATGLLSPARWRIAATLAILVAGTLVTLQLQERRAPATVMLGDTAVAVVESSGTPSARGVGTPANDRRESLLADLADEDLDALISALDKLEAMPAADPDSSGWASVADVDGGAR